MIAMISTLTLLRQISTTPEDSNTGLQAPSNIRVFRRVSSSDSALDNTTPSSSLVTDYKKSISFSHLGENNLQTNQTEKEYLYKEACNIEFECLDESDETKKERLMEETVGAFYLPKELLHSLICFNTNVPEEVQPNPTERAAMEFYYNNYEYLNTSEELKLDWSCRFLVVFDTIFDIFKVDYINIQNFCSVYITSMENKIEKIVESDPEPFTEEGVLDMVYGVDFFGVYNLIHLLISHKDRSFLKNISLINLLINQVEVYNKEIIFSFLLFETESILRFIHDHPDELKIRKRFFKNIFRFLNEVRVISDHKYNPRRSSSESNALEFAVIKLGFNMLREQNSQILAFYYTMKDHENLKPEFFEEEKDGFDIKTVYELFKKTL